MTAEEAWIKIVSSLKGKSIELPTVPKTKKTPVWFTASTDGQVILINNAVENTPSSSLSMERKLTYKTFLKVYPLYLRRENGEQVSEEVTGVTVNQVYFFSLIKHFAS